MPIRRRTVLGRSPYSTLVIDGSTISRQHAILDPRDDGLFVTDAGSRNGTRVNGTLVREPQRVLHGDVIELGHELIVVELGDQESEAWDTPLTSEFVELVAALGAHSGAAGDASGSVPTLDIAPPAVPTVPSPRGSKPETAEDGEPGPDSSHEPRH